MGVERGGKNILGRWTRACTDTNQEQTCILKGEKMSNVGEQHSK